MTTKLPISNQAVPSDEIQAQLDSFGARLRELRRGRGWTLEELACRSGLSRAFLSRLESGGRQASIAAAITLSRIFDVSLSSLFESQLAVEPCVIVRAGEGVEQPVNGLHCRTLSNAGRFFNLQPIVVRVSPDRPGDEHYRHDGEEWIYVLSGRLTLSLAGRKYDLETGDAAHFDSRLPHRLLASGARAAEALVVASPVSSHSPSVAGWPAAARSSRALAGLRLINFSTERSGTGSQARAGRSLAPVRRPKLSRTPTSEQP